MSSTTPIQESPDFPLIANFFTDMAKHFPLMGLPYNLEINGYEFSITAYGLVVNETDVDSPEWRDAISRAMILHNAVVNRLNDLMRQERAAREVFPVIPKVKSGYIYLLKALNGSNHYKIGKSTNVKSRAKMIGTKMPFDVEVICTYHTPDMAREEKDLHDYFATERVNGEWFALSPDDVEFIVEISRESE